MQKYRWLFALLGVAALWLALVFGAALGAGITYFLLQADSVQAAFDAPANVANDEGVLISAVESGSAAEAAGLVRGDLILAIDGQAVNSLLELQAFLAAAEPGESVELSVLHGDETRALIAELGDLNGAAYLGVSTCGGPHGNPDMGKALAISFGAEITEIISNSPAEAAGLQVGDLIFSVDGEMIGPEGRLSDLIQAHQPGDIVTLEIRPAGAEQTQEVRVTLGENPANPEQAYLGVGYQISHPQLEGAQGMPKFFFHNEEFPGQLPEGRDQIAPFFFHGMPGTDSEGLPFHDFSQLPEDFEGAVIVSEVLPDTPAAESGIQPGDLILMVDGQTVTEIEDFVSILQARQPGDQITLTLFRNGEELEVSVVLAQHPDDPTKGFLGVMAGTFGLGQIENLPLPGQDFQFELPDAPGGDA